MARPKHHEYHDLDVTMEEIMNWPAGFTAEKQVLMLRRLVEGKDNELADVRLELKNAMMLIEDLLDETGRRSN